jgi:hypothetical protein
VEKCWQPVSPLKLKHKLVLENGLLRTLTGTETLVVHGSVLSRLNTFGGTSLF